MNCLNFVIKIIPQKYDFYSFVPKLHQSLLSISARYIIQMADIIANEIQLSKLVLARIFLYYFYIFTLMSRLICCFLALNFVLVPCTYFDYDLLLGRFVRLGIIDDIYALIFTFANLTSLYVDWVVHFPRTGGSAQTQMVNLALDLLVFNKKTFLR